MRGNCSDAAGEKEEIRILVPLTEWSKWADSTLSTATHGQRVRVQMRKRQVWNEIRGRDCTVCYFSLEVPEGVVDAKIFLVAEDAEGEEDPQQFYKVVLKHPKRSDVYKIPAQVYDNGNLKEINMMAGLHLRGVDLNTKSEANTDDLM